MRKVLLLLLTLCTTAPAFAEGYQVNLQSTKQAAMGHVGTGLKLGTESMHFNPGALSFMEHDLDFSGGISFIDTKAEYSNGSIKAKTDNSINTPVYAYAGFKVSDNFAAGISVTTPYGSSLDWGRNWAGAALVQDISLMNFAIQPTISYKFLDKIGIGAGLMIMTGNIRLSRALVAPGDLNDLESYIPEVAKYSDVSAASVTIKGNADAKLGYHLGAYWDISSKWSVGIAYRSKVNMSVKKGTAAMHYVNETELKTIINQANALLPDERKIIIPPLDEGTFSSEMPLPSNLTIGVTFRPGDRWIVSADVQFTGWSAYKSLDIQFSEQVLGGYSLESTKKYKDTKAFRIGTEYAVSKRFDLRLGTYFDQSPIREDYYNPETPGANKLAFSTGFSFRPLNRFSIDTAFTYIKALERDGSCVYDPRKDPFAGTYNSRAFIGSIGVSYSF